MGYSLSWLAVRGKPREVVLEELELRSTVALAAVRSRYANGV